MEIQLTSEYTQQGLYRAIDIYNFQEEYKLKYILYSIRYLYQYRYKYRNSPTKEQLDTRIIFLFNKYKNNENCPEINEIIDIIVEYFSNSHIYLNELRNIENERFRLNVEPHVVENERFRLNVEAPINLIYNDTQNVHNTHINKTIKSCSIRLVTNYLLPHTTTIDKIEFYLETKYNKDSIYIKQVIKRIKEDVANFNINISLIEVFMSLWNWIHKKEHSLDIINELENILVEEIKSMNGMCATGHLSRLINVTQGYTEEFVITITNEEQANSVVRTYLTNKLKNCNEENVLEGIVDKSPYFISFIDNSIEEQLPIWTLEYGEDFIIYVPKIVYKYIHG